MQLETTLLHRKLCSKILGMSEIQDARAWFSSITGKRVTAVEMSEILGISRNATNARLAKGMDSEDLIAISRGLGISPIHALVELGKITYEEVFKFLDSDGTLLASATPEQLIYQLAEESLPASDRIALGAAAKALTDRRDDLAARRPTPDVQPLTDDEEAAIIEEANQLRGAAHPRTPRLDEPEDP